MQYNGSEKHPLTIQSENTTPAHETLACVAFGLRNGGISAEFQPSAPYVYSKHDEATTNRPN